MWTSTWTASQRSSRSSQAAATSSSRAAGLRGGSDQGRAKDSGSVPRWRVSSSRMLSMKAALISPPEGVMCLSKTFQT
jgi:hypothetical protein